MLLSTNLARSHMRPRTILFPQSTWKVPSPAGREVFSAEAVHPLLTESAGAMVEAASAVAETGSLDFKEEFDPASLGDWCELVKDVVAMANSGGGAIVFGVRDDGSNNEHFDESRFKGVDPAHITDTVRKYTGTHFASFRLTTVERQGVGRPTLVVNGHPPIIFSSPGTYPIEGNRQKTAFSVGTLYVRHGAKSEPATTDDLRRILDAQVEGIKHSWLEGIRKVVEAPPGAVVAIVSPDATGATHTPVRLVQDAGAAPAITLDRDKTHPYRMKELVKALNDRIGTGRRLTSHDVQCVRRAIDADVKHPAFVHKARFSSPQYSDAFLDWMVSQHGADPLFFERMRSEQSA